MDAIDIYRAGYDDGLAAGRQECKERLDEVLAMIEDYESKEKRDEARI